MAIKISQLANLTAYTDSVFLPVVETAGNTFSTVKSTSSALKTYVLGTIPTEITDLTSNTLATTDLLLASDGGTEGRITLGQIDTLFTSTTQTLTNKTLTSPKINEDVAVTATATEINHTDGVTSNIQTQIDTKATTAFAIAQAVALG